MGSELQATVDDILDIVRELRKIPLRPACRASDTVVKIDERVDRPTRTFEDKVRAVEKKLNRAAGR